MHISQANNIAQGTKTWAADLECMIQDRLKKCTTSTFMAVVIFQTGTPIVQISWPCKNRRHSQASTEAYSEMGTAANAYFKKSKYLTILTQIEKETTKNRSVLS